MKHILLALVLLCGLTGVVSADDYQDGLDAALRGHGAEAIAKFKKAGEAGNVRAQFMLGDIYRLGDDVPKDTKEALRWYQKAAEGGYIVSQHTLARMYELGRGVLQDHQKVIYWYTQGAESGDAQSQVQLGRIYHELQDYVKAHKWFNLAGTHFTSQMLIDAATKSRDDIAKKMSPQQMAEAQQLARDWKPKPSSTPDR
jgi:TPR repeat protein